jgi:hypothetical protein
MSTLTLTQIFTQYTKVEKSCDSSLEVRMFNVLSATRSGARVASRQAFVAFVLFTISCVGCRLPGIGVRTAVF